MITYPTRCQIIDVTEREVFPGIIGRTPDVSKPHVGKYGTAEQVTADCYVKITLDDGNVLWGYECWWMPVSDEHTMPVQRDVQGAQGA